MSDNTALQVIKPEPAAVTAFAGVNIEALLEKALTAESAVEVLERLMVMRREMKAEAAKEAFDSAMAAFQAECPVIKKDSAVHERGSSQVRYRYAPLDSIVHQVQGLLQKHGFSHRLTAKVDNEIVTNKSNQQVQGGFVTAICKVIHSQGHSEESEFKIPIDPDGYMNQAQKFASALTFAKRYAFCNAFGILTGDQDDDSRSAEDDSPRPAARSAAPQQRPAQQPPTSKPANVTTPGAAPAAAKPPEKVLTKPARFATKATRDWAINEIKALSQATDPAMGSALEGLLLEFLQKSGCILPNEGLDAWPFKYVPVDKTQLAQLHKAVTAFEAGAEAKFPFYNEDPNPPAPEAKPKKATPSDKEKAIEVPREGTETTGEAWRDFKVPFGKHSGVRLEDLDPNVLWGFWKNIKVELEWNGRPRPAEKIASDKLFRAMLDEAGKHYQFTDQ